GRTVDQGSTRGHHLFAAPDQGRPALGAVLYGLADQDLGQLLLRAGNGDGEPVEQALLGALDKILGQVAPGKGGRGAGERCSDGNGLHGASSGSGGKVSTGEQCIVHHRSRMARSGRRPPSTRPSIDIWRQGIANCNAPVTTPPGGGGQWPRSRKSPPA